MRGTITAGEAVWRWRWHMQVAFSQCLSKTAQNMSALLPICLWRPQVVRQSPFGRPCRSSSSDANALVSSPSFEEQYDELASILAPGGTVRAAPTPLG